MAVYIQIPLETLLDRARAALARLASCDICPRRNYVIRRASNLSKESHIIAANIDQALLLATLRAPETATEFVDRFLVTCEAYKVPVTIALSKADLQDPSAMAEFRAVYEGAGYRVLEVSATEGVGVEAVCELLEGRVTLLSGNSGVGKSTLIHAIDPSLDIRTGEISDSHHKGRHTTTFSTMYPLAGGGAVIDTPGIKGFGLIDIDDAELWHYFPEMMRIQFFYLCQEFFKLSKWFFDNTYHVWIVFRIKIFTLQG